MRRRTVILLVLIGVATLGHPQAGAVTAPSGIDPRLHLEWEVREGRDGRPVITGYIHNDYGRPAINVRLLSVAVDALGQEGYPSAPAWFERQYKKHYEPFTGAWHQ